MIVYRLCRAPFARGCLDGEGARLYGGRWNPKGVRMVYAASSLSLAALESFVHFSSAALPLDFVSVAVEIPDDLPVETWGAPDLPRGWTDTPAPTVLQTLGGRWVARGKGAILRVPSAVIAHETNVLINPLHPDAARCRLATPEPFVFDPRLIKTPARLKRHRKG